MAPRKKTESQYKHGPVSPNAGIENAGVMVEQPITWKRTICPMR